MGGLGQPRIECTRDAVRYGRMILVDSKLGLPFNCSFNALKRFERGKQTCALEAPSEISVTISKSTTNAQTLHTLSRSESKRACTFVNLQNAKLFHALLNWVLCDVIIQT